MTDSPSMTNHRVHETPDAGGDRRFFVAADFTDGVCEPFGVEIVSNLTEFEANYMAAHPDCLSERETFMIERNLHLLAKRRVEASSSLKPAAYDLERAEKAYIEAYRAWAAKAQSGTGNPTAEF